MHPFLIETRMRYCVAGIMSLSKWLRLVECMQQLNRGEFNVEAFCLLKDHSNFMYSWLIFEAVIVFAVAKRLECFKSRSLL